MIGRSKMAFILSGESCFCVIIAQMEQPFCEQTMSDIFLRTYKSHKCLYMVYKVLFEISLVIKLFGCNVFSQFIVVKVEKTELKANCFILGK